VQPPADLDVRLVEPDHEALVQVSIGLAMDRLDDRLGAVAQVLAGDPSGEVEVLPAVGVPDRRALRPCDYYVCRRDAARDVSLPAGPDSFRVDALLDRHRCQLRALSRWGLARRIGVAFSKNPYLGLNQQCR